MPGDTCAGASKRQRKAARTSVALKMWNVGSVSPDATDVLGYRFLPTAGRGRKNEKYRWDADNTCTTLNYFCLIGRLFLSFLELFC